jgi:excisionase family DNA binding protein
MSQTVNVKGAADLLKVHPKTVEDLIRSCALPAAKVGRAYVVMTKDVMDYLENQIIRQTAQRMRESPKRSRKVGAS